MLNQEGVYPRWHEMLRHSYGSEAKPTRSEKVEVGVIFDFHDGEKPQVYPLRYIEDFSHR